MSAPDRDRRGRQDPGGRRAEPPSRPPRPPVSPSRQIAAGGYSRPLPGFVECGDTFVIELVEREPGGALLVAVVDGLGHGNEAGIAAHAAARTVLGHRELPLEQILRHCDQQLHPTRGAAMAVLRLEADGRGEFCGVGNIEVQSLAGQPAGLFCLPGIVGHSVRVLRTMPFTMQSGDIYCLHTDGVSSRGDLRGCLPGAPQTVARRIVDAWGRPHDDATAVVLGYGAGAKLPAGIQAPAGAGPTAAQN
jgi:Stage II sporulation protein E (SpoIIE)